MSVTLSQEAFPGKRGSVRWCDLCMCDVRVCLCVCQAYGVMHRVGHLCIRALDAKRKSNQGAERNQPQGGAQDRQRMMTTRIQTETGSRKGQ